MGNKFITEDGVEYRILDKPVIEDKITIEEANKEFDRIEILQFDTIFCYARRDRYGMPISVQVEGEFTPEQLKEIAAIAERINYEEPNERNAQPQPKVG